MCVFVGVSVCRLYISALKYEAVHLFAVACVCVVCVCVCLCVCACACACACARACMHACRCAEYDMQGEVTQQVRGVDGAPDL